MLPFLSKRAKITIGVNLIYQLFCCYLPLDRQQASSVPLFKSSDKAVEESTDITILPCQIPKFHGNLVHIFRKGQITLS